MTTREIQTPLKVERPTHYAAHGSSGLTFECYQAHLGLHLGSQYQAATTKDRFRRTRYRYPAPCQSTDLRRVNCGDCWQAIARMADNALNGKV